MDAERACGTGKADQGVARALADAGGDEIGHDRSRHDAEQERRGDETQIKVERHHMAGQAECRMRKTGGRTGARPRTFLMAAVFPLMDWPSSICRTGRRIL